jgi:hypothetical protein
MSAHPISALWDALAEDDIRHAEFWSAYRDHLVRRNGIVHEGSLIGPEDAERSIKAAQDLCAHVTSHAP